MMPRRGSNSLPSGGPGLASAGKDYPKPPSLSSGVFFPYPSIAFAVTCLVLNGSAGIVGLVAFAGLVVHRAVAKSNHQNEDIPQHQAPAELQDRPDLEAAMTEQDRKVLYRYLMSERDLLPSLPNSSSIAPHAQQENDLLELQQRGSSDIANNHLPVAEVRCLAMTLDEEQMMKAGIIASLSAFEATGAAGVTGATGVTGAAGVIGEQKIEVPVFHDEDEDALLNTAVDESLNGSSIDDDSVDWELVETKEEAQEGETKMEPNVVEPTSLDLFMALEFSENQARKALDQNNGNFTEACYLLLQWRPKLVVESTRSAILKKLGFREKEAATALIQSGGNLKGAVTLLLASSDRFGRNQNGPGYWFNNSKQHSHW